MTRKAKPHVTPYCQVHQFHGDIAVYLGGKTVYMTPEEAQTLAQALLSHAYHAMTVPFGQSTLGTFSMYMTERKD